MFTCKMIINRLHIESNQMEIGVAISCPFDVDVSSPKAKIIFECDGHTRRLPLRVVNYFRQKQEESCIVVCNYTFMLDYIFYEYEPTSPITVTIGFEYGQQSVSAVPFLVSTNVLNENPEINLDENYIEYECFDGITVFDAHDSDYVEPDEAADKSYSFDFDCENNAILIYPNTNKDARLPFTKRSKIIVPLLRFIDFCLRVIAAVCLLPLFLFDGILAGLNIVPRRKTAQIDGKLKNIFVQFKINLSSFLKTSFKRSNFVENIRRPLYWITNVYYKFLCRKDVVPNRITFMSGRRDELGGNPEFVYNLIKDDPNIEFRFLLFSDANGHHRIKNILKFVKLYSSSRVVIVDDYFRLLNIVKKRSDVKLVQLWHACGAFKTFGFTRLGKAGGPKQDDPNHRMYDAAIVSSTEIAKHYAEGFGLSDEKVIATGIPRTDIFMDKDYGAKVSKEFYDKHPSMKDKKIILFAPTFRGNGQMTAYYPPDAFHVDEFMKAIPDDYALLIKYHPFCPERPVIPEEYKDRVLDLSDEDELNDLLFVTDLLITDYSSVVFEASLLNIPMLFYAYDLFDYISKRDFYYDFESFVPGKIVFSQRELTQAINDGDYDSEKIPDFKTKFFDHLDGQSSRRVADMILSYIEKK